MSALNDFRALHTQVMAHIYYVDSILGEADIRSFETFFEMKTFQNILSTMDEYNLDANQKFILDKRFKSIKLSAQEIFDSIFDIISLSKKERQKYCAENQQVHLHLCIREYYLKLKNIFVSDIFAEFIVLEA